MCLVTYEWHRGSTRPKRGDWGEICLRFSVYDGKKLQSHNFSFTCNSETDRESINYRVSGSRRLHAFRGFSQRILLVSTVKHRPIPQHHQLAIDTLVHGAEEDFHRPTRWAPCPNVIPVNAADGRLIEQGRWHGLLPLVLCPTASDGEG